MKKFISITALVITLSMAVVSFAEVDYTTTYHSQDTSVSSKNAATSRTVLIIKGEETSEEITPANVVYINQPSEEETAFSESTRFFLTSGAEDGIYTIIFENGESKKFAIGIGEVVRDVELDHLTKDDGSSADEAVEADGSNAGTTYKMGFVYNTPLNMADYQEILITMGDKGNENYKVLSYEVPTVFTGEADAEIGVQLNRIPENIYNTYQGSIKMYLRPILNKSE